MRHIALASTLLSVLVSACDDGADLDSRPHQPGFALIAPVDAPARDEADVEFREQGKPWQVYLPTAHDVESFAKMLQACDITPGLTVSLSGYLPDVTYVDAQVVGFGFSMMASQSLKDCMYDMMIEQGAIEI